MSTEHTITIKALGGNLTVASLRAFLDQFDKATEEGRVYPGFHDELKPKVRVRFGGGIKSITVTVPGDTPAT
jgi:hypothetical protein